MKSTRDSTRRKYPFASQDTAPANVLSDLDKWLAYTLLARKDCIFDERLAMTPLLIVKLRSYEAETTRRHVPVLATLTITVLQVVKNRQSSTAENVVVVQLLRQVRAYKILMTRFPIDCGKDLCTARGATLKHALRLV